MKTSIHLFLTDILPLKRRFFNKIVKNKMFDGSTTIKIFDQLKKSKVDGIELLVPSFATKEDIMEVKKIADENDIKILSVHQALRFLTITRIKEIKSLLEIAKIFSA